jgi:hypothetical protein
VLKCATVTNKKEVVLDGRRVGNRVSRKRKRNGDIIIPNLSFTVNFYITVLTNFS